MNDLEVIAIQPHLWILPLIAAIFAALTVILLRVGKKVAARKTAADVEKYRYITATKTSTYETGAGFSGILMAVFAGCFALTWILMLMPYGSQYHVLYRLDGTVEHVTQTFENGSGEMSGMPVVTVEGFDQPIIVNQARIYSYSGRDIQFTCSLSWVPYGQDYLDCIIAGVNE